MHPLFPIPDGNMTVCLGNRRMPSGPIPAKVCSKDLTQADRCWIQTNTQ